MNSAYQEFTALHPVVRAVRIAPVLDDDKPSAERAYVVDGVGVIDAATFARLYEPRVATQVPIRVKKERKVARRAPARTTAAAAQPLSIRDAIRQAVHESPRTTAEICDRVAEIIPSAGRESVTTMLSQLRAKNEIGKGDDLKWRMTGTQGRVA
jgi:hypothetical protein